VQIAREARAVEIILQVRLLPGALEALQKSLWLAPCDP
jgi:hypothetical protein